MCLWRKIANIRYDLERNPIHLPPKNRLSTGFPSRLNHSFWFLIEKVQTCGQMKLSPVIKAWHSNPILLHVTCWLLRSRRLYCSKTWWWVNLGARLDTGEWGSPNRAASGGVFCSIWTQKKCFTFVQKSISKQTLIILNVPYLCHSLWKGLQDLRNSQKVCKSQWSSKDQHLQN